MSNNIDRFRLGGKKIWSLEENFGGKGKGNINTYSLKVGGW